MSASDSGRNESLDQIRRTYREYREQGRDRLWDSANRGYARIVRDRDRALVQLIRQSLPAGGSVLDIGSGPGDLADLVRAEADDAFWTGVDLLPEAITDARRFRPWATWIEASADQLPFSNASFDVVVASTLFSSLVVHHLEHTAAAEVARVLRPGGWLVWYDLRYDNPRNHAVSGVTAKMLATLFPGWQAQLRTVTLVPPLARRLGPATWLVYPTLAAVPMLRSHLIGRFRKPRGG